MPRLKRALEVHVADLFAQVCLGADEADEAVLDSQKNVSALLDGLLHGPAGLDKEFLATINKLVSDPIQRVTEIPTASAGWETGRRSR